MDSVDYNGIMSKVFANQNVAKAYLYGATASVTVNFNNQLKLFSTINYTYGRLKGADKKVVPLDHIPPVYGKTAFSYSSNRITAETYALYNGWKKLKDYNPSGEDNAQYATADGTPAWVTFNFKSTLNLAKYLSLQLGVENIFDRNYRYFASGFSAPGRNYIVAIRSNF
jgi:hemoglobin/transferrin/lactoferrin receptor protein